MTLCLELKFNLPEKGSSRKTKVGEPGAPWGLLLINPVFSFAKLPPSVL